MKRLVLLLCLVSCSKPPPQKVYHEYPFATRYYKVLVGPLSDIAGHWTYEKTEWGEHAQYFRVAGSPIFPAAIVTTEPAEGVDEEMRYQMFVRLQKNIGVHLSDREFCPEIENGTQFALTGDNTDTAARFVFVESGDKHLTIQLTYRNTPEQANLVHVFLKNFKPEVDHDVPFR